MRCWVQRGNVICLKALSTPASRRGLICRQEADPRPKEKVAYFIKRTKEILSLIEGGNLSYL